MNAMDVSFRLGFEEGQKAAMLEQMQQQIQQMAAEAEAAAAQPPVEGEGELSPEEQAAMEEGQPQEPEQEGDDQLDNSIDELENYVKHEEKLNDLKKSLDLGAGETKEIQPKDNAKVKQVTEMIKSWEEEEQEEQES